MGEKDGPERDEIVPPLVNTRDIPLKIKKGYVCWLDLMGVEVQMSTSLESTAIDMFNLHIAMDQVNADYDLNIYPMMDGAYIVSEEQSDLRDYLADVLAMVAVDNVDSDSDVEYTYIPRASVAFGPLVEGREQLSRLSPEYDFFSEMNNYPNKLLIGAPVTQAVAGESKAPPYGIFVHETARAFAPNGDRPMDSRWFEWFRHHDPYKELARDLRDRMKSYYEWCEANSNQIGYPVEKMQVHKEMALEYLPE